MPKKIEDYLYYEEDGFKIYNGDCLDIMPLLGGVDMILTDPPYGIDFQSAWPTEGRKKEKIENDKLEDWLLILPTMLERFKDSLNEGGVCCCCGGGGGTPSLAYLWIEAGKIFDVENVLIWDKGFVGMGWRYRFQWEAVLVATKGERKVWNGGTNQSNILNYQKVIPQNGQHPTVKPVSLMKKLITDNSNVGDLILDPFAGSGTTLLACKETDRRGIAIELNEKYCRLAKTRLMNTQRMMI